jgi:transposase
MRTPGSAEELERNRMIAANMFEQGLKAVQVARSLEVDDQTVRRWRRVYTLKGREGLRGRKHPGRPPRLNLEQKEQLRQWLLKTPQEVGFADKHLWTTQLIADLIQREFGVDYHHDHVGTMLHAMGFTHQKPARRAQERDEAKIAAWRREVWPDLLKKVPTTTA